MSVKRTVASARSIGRRGRSPVRNSFDLVHDALDVAHKRIVLIAGKLDEASAEDVLGEVVPTVDQGGHVAAAVQDQCRRGDRGKRGRRRRPSVPARQLSGPAGRCGETLEPREPAVKALVLEGRRDDRRKVTASPPAVEVLVHELEYGLAEGRRPSSRSTRR